MGLMGLRQATALEERKLRELRLMREGSLRMERLEEWKKITRSLIKGGSDKMVDWIWRL